MQVVGSPIALQGENDYTQRNADRFAAAINTVARPVRHRSCARDPCFSHRPVTLCVFTR